MNTHTLHHRRSISPSHAALMVGMQAGAVSHRDLADYFNATPAQVRAIMLGRDDPPGRRGGHREPLDVNTCLAAIEVVSFVTWARADLAPPRVEVGADDELILTWEAGDRHLEVEVSPRGAIEAFFEAPDHRGPTDAWPVVITPHHLTTGTGRLRQAVCAVADAGFMHRLG